MYCKALRCGLLLVILNVPHAAMSQNPLELTASYSDQTEPTKLTDNIYVVYGFGNTFLVKTDEGDVVIDTTLPRVAVRHRELMKKISTAPVRDIIVTHGHADHVGGVSAWMEDGTQYIAQQNHVEFLKYQDRLSGIFAIRNAAQFNLNENLLRNLAKNPPKRPQPSILFDQEYFFELGGVRFELYHMPGETSDQLAVWLPQQKAIFVGDNFYTSFPNIYTLRGTKPRWALEYVESLDRMIEFNAEILLPSHGKEIVGAEKIKAALTRYRDAIQYVHDATVAGMNNGQDVFTLMQQIKLPPELDVGERYGRVDWTVRGIYEGYMGFFDGNPSNMYGTPSSAVYPDLVEMAGGADAVAAKARKLIDAGETLRGLRMADIALTADAKNKIALQARKAAFEALLKKSRNFIERDWLSYGLRKTQQALKNE